MFLLPYLLCGRTEETTYLQELSIFFNPYPKNMFSNERTGMVHRTFREVGQRRLKISEQSWCGAEHSTCVSSPCPRAPLGPWVQPLSLDGTQLLPWGTLAEHQLAATGDLASWSLHWKINWAHNGQSFEFHSKELYLQSGDRVLNRVGLKSPELATSIHASDGYVPHWRGKPYRVKGFIFYLKTLWANSSGCLTGKLSRVAASREPNSYSNQAATNHSQFHPLGFPFRSLTGSKPASEFVPLSLPCHPSQLSESHQQVLSLLLDVEAIPGTGRLFFLHNPPQG